MAVSTTGAYSSQTYAPSCGYEAAGRAQARTYPNPEGEQAPAHYSGQGGVPPDRLTSSPGLPNPVDSAAITSTGNCGRWRRGTAPPTARR